MARRKKPDKSYNLDLSKHKVDLTGRFHRSISIQIDDDQKKRYILPDALLLDTEFAKNVPYLTSDKPVIIVIESSRTDKRNRTLKPIYEAEMGVLATLMMEEEGSCIFDIKLSNFDDYYLIEGSLDGPRAMLIRRDKFYIFNIVPRPPLHGGGIMHYNLEYDGSIYAVLGEPEMIEFAQRYDLKDVLLKIIM